MDNVDAKVIERIKKLLALANNNPNEAEAEAAMAKATEMLEAYNLDMAILGHTAKGAQRSDTKRSGGLYSWQRKLWAAVAELNFCHYLSIKGLKAGSTYEHRLIGSHANVIATEAMASYLQGAVEKLAQKWAKEEGFKSVFVRDAIAYREGMTGRLTERLAQRRREVLKAERQREEERKRDEQARGQASTSTAMTLVQVISTEADFNNDYLNGWELGTTAQNRHDDEVRQKRWEAERKAAAELHRNKMVNDPAYAAEQLAKQAASDKWWEEFMAKQAKKEKRRSTYVTKAPRPRAQTAEEKRQGLASYWDGYDKGDSVGIDTQIDNTKQKAVR